MMNTALFVFLFRVLSGFLIASISSTWVSALPLAKTALNKQHGFGGEHSQCLLQVSSEDRTALEQGLIHVRSFPPQSHLQPQPQLLPRSRALPPPAVQINQTHFTFNVSFNIVFTNATIDGGWVSEARVQDQMATLNRDYEGTGIAWRLLGVRWIRSADWFVNAYPGSEQEQAMKMMFNEGDASTLNVYTMTFNSSTKSLGTSSIPSAYYRSPKSDGVMIRHSTVNGGTREHYNMGRTLTHEVGHWLGLFHTFEGGCDDGVGDNVDDTPPASSGSEGCPVGRDSCPGGGVDLINNFMDYSYDACMSSFTKGQAQRMREAAWAFRRPGGRTAPPTTTKVKSTTSTSTTANSSTGSSSSTRSTGTSTKTSTETSARTSAGSAPMSASSTIASASASAGASAGTSTAKPTEHTHGV